MFQFAPRASFRPTNLESCPYAGLVLLAAPPIDHASSGSLANCLAFQRHARSVKARRERPGRIIKISRLTRAAFWLTIFYCLVAPGLAPARATPLPCALVRA